MEDRFIIVPDDESPHTDGVPEDTSTNDEEVNLLNSIATPSGFWMSTEEFNRGREELLSGIQGSMSPEDLINFIRSDTVSTHEGVMPEEVGLSIENLNRTMQDFLGLENRSDTPTVDTNTPIPEERMLNELGNSIGIREQIHSSPIGISDLTIERLQATIDSLTGITAPVTLTDPYSAEDLFESIDDIVEMSTLTQPTTESIHQEIPPNSGSVLIEESTSRFSGAIWFEEIKKKNIILAGLGGIGSYVAFLLSRMQPNSISLYDDDIVELGNLSGQLYSKSNIGFKKTTSLSAMMDSYGNYHSIFNFGKYETSSSSGDIMICGFDNMVARKTMFTNWLEHVKSLPPNKRSKCLFIDGRLSAEFLQVFCLKGDNHYFINKYKKEQLFSDREADETLCSYKQTTFMANMIGSIIVNLFVNFVANECNPPIERDVPYLTEYNAETMYLNTIS